MIPHSKHHAEVRLSTQKFANLLGRAVQRAERRVFCEILARYAAPAGRGISCLLYCADGGDAELLSRTLSYSALMALVVSRESAPREFMVPSVDQTPLNTSVGCHGEQISALLLASRLDPGGVGRVSGRIMLGGALRAWHRKSDLLWRRVVQRSSVGRLHPSQAAHVLLGGRHRATAIEELYKGLRQHVLDMPSEVVEPAVSNSEMIFIADLRLCGARTRVATAEVRRARLSGEAAQKEESTALRRPRESSTKSNQLATMYNGLAETISRASAYYDVGADTSDEGSDAVDMRNSSSWPPPPEPFSLRARDLTSYLSFRSQLVIHDSFDRLVHGVETFNGTGHRLRDVLRNLAEKNIREHEIGTETDAAISATSGKDRDESISHANLIDIVRRYEIPLAKEELVTMLAQLDPNNSGEISIERFCGEAQVNKCAVLLNVFLTLPFLTIIILLHIDERNQTFADIDNLVLLPISTGLGSDAGVQLYASSQERDGVLTREELEHALCRLAAFPPKLAVSLGDNENDKTTLHPEGRSYERLWHVVLDPSFVPPHSVENLRVDLGREQVVTVERLVMCILGHRQRRARRAWSSIAEAVYLRTATQQLRRRSRGSRVGAAQLSGKDIRNFLADKAGKRGTESALGYEEMEGVLKLLDLEKATNDPPLILQDLIWSLDPVESGSISLLAIEIAFDEWASSVRPFYPNKGSIPSGAETLLRSSPFVDLDVYYREPVALRGKAHQVFLKSGELLQMLATATSKCRKELADYAVRHFKATQRSAAKGTSAASYFTRSQEAYKVDMGEMIELNMAAAKSVAVQRSELATLVPRAQEDESYSAPFPLASKFQILSGLEQVRLQKLLTSLSGRPLQRQVGRLLEAQKKVHDLYTSARGFRLHGSLLTEEMEKERWKLKRSMLSTLHGLRLITDTASDDTKPSSAVKASAAWRETAARNLWRDLALGLKYAADSAAISAAAGDRTGRHGTTADVQRKFLAYLHHRDDGSGFVTSLAFLQALRRFGLVTGSATNEDDVDIMLSEIDEGERGVAKLCDIKKRVNIAVMEHVNPNSTAAGRAATAAVSAAASTAADIIGGVGRLVSQAMKSTPPLRMDKEASGRHAIIQSALELGEFEKAEMLQKSRGKIPPELLPYNPSSVYSEDPDDNADNRTGAEPDIFSLKVKKSGLTVVDGVNSCCHHIHLCHHTLYSYSFMGARCSAWFVESRSSTY